MYLVSRIEDRDKDRVIGNVGFPPLREKKLSYHREAFLHFGVPRWTMQIHTRIEIKLSFDCLDYSC